MAERVIEHVCAWAAGGAELGQWDQVSFGVIGKCQQYDTTGQGWEVDRWVKQGGGPRKPGDQVPSTSWIRVPLCALLGPEA